MDQAMMSKGRQQVIHLPNNFFFKSNVHVSVHGQVVFAPLQLGYEHEMQGRVVWLPHSFVILIATAP